MYEVRMVRVSPSYAILWSILKMLCSTCMCLSGTWSWLAGCGGKADAVDTVGEGGLKPIPTSLTHILFLRHDPQVCMK